MPVDAASGQRTRFPFRIRVRRATFEQIDLIPFDTDHDSFAATAGQSPVPPPSTSRERHQQMSITQQFQGVANNSPGEMSSEHLLGSSSRPCDPAAKREPNLKVYFRGRLFRDFMKASSCGTASFYSGDSNAVDEHLVPVCKRPRLAITFKEAAVVQELTGTVSQGCDPKPEELVSRVIDVHIPKGISEPAVENQNLNLSSEIHEGHLLLPNVTCFIPFQVEPGDLVSESPSISVLFQSETSPCLLMDVVNLDSIVENIEVSLPQEQTFLEDDDASIEFLEPQKNNLNTARSLPVPKENHLCESHQDGAVEEIVDCADLSTDFQCPPEVGSEIELQDVRPPSPQCSEELLGVGDDDHDNGDSLSTIVERDEQEVPRDLTMATSPSSRHHYDGYDFEDYYEAELEREVKKTHVVEVENEASKTIGLEPPAVVPVLRDKASRARAIWHHGLRLGLSRKQLVRPLHNFNSVSRRDVWTGLTSTDN